MSRRATIQLTRQLLSRSQRRYASEGTHSHAQPVNEGFGVWLLIHPIVHHSSILTSPPQTGFYITLAAIPFSFIIYKATQAVKTGDDPFVTQFIKKYDYWLQTYRERNELHTKMVEQAGYDRLILQHSPKNEGVDYKFNEYVPRNIMISMKVIANAISQSFQYRITI